MITTDTDMKSFILDGITLDSNTLEKNLLGRKITKMAVSNTGHCTLWLTFDNNTEMAVCALQNGEPSIASFFKVSNPQ